jgi:hypothetical protein
MKAVSAVRSAPIWSPLGVDLGIGLLLLAAGFTLSHWTPMPVCGFLFACAAGALALNSHRRQMTGDESDRPLLAAGLVALAVLYIALFNCWPGQLWGFDQFCGQKRLALWVGLGALLPLWHSATLSGLHALAARRAGRKMLPAPLFYGPPIALFWILSPHQITEDGWGLIAVARGEFAIEGVLREPLAYLLPRLIHAAGAPIGIDAREAIAIVSVTSGVVSLWALRRLWRLWQLGPLETALAWIVTAATFGLTQMWFGHIEVYPPFSASVVCLFYFGSRALRENRENRGQQPNFLGRSAAGRPNVQEIRLLSPIFPIFSSQGEGLRSGALWLAGVAYAFAFAFHIGAAWLAPGMLVLVALAARSGGRRAGIAAFAQVALPFLAIQSVLWTAIYLAGFHADAPRFGRALAHVVTASRLTPPFYHLSEIGARFWLDRFQVLFVLCGAPLSILALSAFRPFVVPTLVGFSKAPAEAGTTNALSDLHPFVVPTLVGFSKAPAEAGTTNGDRRVRARGAWRDAELLFFAATGAGYGLYALTWRPERPWRQDWDLFSGLAPMLLLLSLKIVLAHKPDRAAWRGFQILLGLFLVLGGLRTWNLHATWTVINPVRDAGGLMILSEEAYPLQQYYIDLRRSETECPVLRNGKIEFVKAPK